MDLTPGPEPKFGDRVRVQCSATGRYIGNGWALVISAMDNDLFLDRVKVGVEPSPTLPVPCDEALDAARMAYRAGREDWARGVVGYLYVGPDGREMLLDPADVTIVRSENQQPRTPVADVTP